MSAPASIPRRMIRQLPENGYESPLPSPHAGGAEFFIPRPRLARGERMRVAYTRESVEATVETAARERGGQTNIPNEVPNGILNGNLNGTLNGSPNACVEGPQQLEEIEEKPRIVGFRDRIGCYTWTWFTMTMATGGIANVLHSIPWRSDWLRIIGVVVFFFNLCLFFTNCTLLTLRFRLNPGSLVNSFLSPSESLFIPACVVSSGTILINMCQYGIPETGEWFQTAMQVCFWAYASVAVMASASIYLIIWSTQTFPIHTMTPIWIFPAYPLLLTAPLAANLIDALPSAAAAARINSLAIALAAVSLQGTGFLVSLMVLSAFIYRLMTQKIPRETTRPGMFVSVGPSGFTVAGIVHLGNIVQTKIIPDGFSGVPQAGAFLKLLADMAGLWMWGLCLWFLLVSIGAHWTLLLRWRQGRVHRDRHIIHFDMTWYSFVFPNTAMVTATQAVGKTLGASAIQVFGTVMACLLILMWAFVFSMMIRALVLKRLLWPGSDKRPDMGIEKTATARSTGRRTDEEE